MIFTTYDHSDTCFHPAVTHVSPNSGEAENTEIKDQISFMKLMRNQVKQCI